MVEQFVHGCPKGASLYMAVQRVPAHSDSLQVNNQTFRVELKTVISIPSLFNYTEFYIEGDGYDKKLHVVL